MAQVRLSMRKIREVFRLKWECGLSNRQIAASIKVGRKTVANYLKKAEELGIHVWPDLQRWDDQQLEEIMFPLPPSPIERLSRRLQLNWDGVHEELRTHKNLTLMQVWREYKEQHPDGLEYSQFTCHYKAYKQKLGLVMRQDHKPGEKLFVDYCDGLAITDPQTGEKTPTDLFVSVWGASN